ncbi:right-handed parallel beta-helix repeat-containing protein [Larkinella soli]|uniref:right-handed parallel beta-helix repeat-containing protein n=1 Tax=Larkinella soli TaxID=1770527 RepID=UPI000FFBE499|nr:right-handed parallel beta-helix repeat-containing protein [Larkinella soli]
MKGGIRQWMLFGLLAVSLAGRGQTVRTSEDRTIASDTVDQSGMDVSGWMDFTWFQPKGDGLTDDTPKLLQALTLCRARNLGLLVDPAKTYLLRTPVDFQFTGTVAVKSRRPGKPAVFLLPDTQQVPFQFTAGAGSLNTRITRDVAAGDRTVSLASTAGLNVGDLLLIQSTADWPIETGTKKGEFNVVEAISGPTVTLKQPCQDAYTVSEIKSVTSYRPARLFLQDIELSVRKTGNRPVVGLSLRYLQYSIINRVTIRHAQYASSQFYGCYDTEIAYCVFEKANEEGQGYGIATVGGLLYNVHDNRSFGCRKLCDFSSSGIGGPTRLSRATGNVAVGEGETNLGNDLFTIQSFCIATHGGAEGILIQGNTATNCQTGFQLRGKDITLNGNLILGKCQLPISLSGGQNHVVTNNAYHSLLKAGGGSPDPASYPGAGIELAGTLLPAGYLTIKGNSFDYVRNYGIYADHVRQRCVIQHNHFEFAGPVRAANNPVLVLWDGVRAPVSGLRVRDNTFNPSAEGAGPGSGLMTLVRNASAYPTGALLDWAACDVQGLRAADVLTVGSETGETPTQVSLEKLYIDQKDHVFSLTGEFSFRFRTAVRPVLIGAAPPASPVQFGFGTTESDGLLVGKVAAGAGQIGFGAQTGSFGGTFNGDSRYTFVVDIRYRTP